MSDELKPCPFCGCLAWMHCHNGVLEMGRAGWRVECEGKCHAMTCYWHERGQAVSAWNTRTPEQNEAKTRTADQTVNPTVNSENALDDESEKT